MSRLNPNKPGPGVPKNAPRKKGPARFFELLGRHFGALVKVNLLYQLCILPAQLFLLLALAAFFVYTNALWFGLFGLLALAAGCAVGPATGALYFCLTRLMHDESGFIGHDFWRAFKENFRGLSGLGLFYSVLLGAQVFTALYFTGLQLAPNVLLLAVYLLAVLVFATVFPYVFLQGPYVELGPGAMLKNGVLLAVGFLPRNLAGAVLGGGLLALQFIYFPMALPLTVLIGYAIPALIQMMWMWPPFDKTFEIDSTLAARAKEGGTEEESTK